MPPVKTRPTAESTTQGRESSEYSNAHWTRQVVRYSPKDGRKSFASEGLVYGPWAVVKDERDGTYDLYHVRTDNPTALGLRTEEDACRIGDWLWKTFPLILRLTTVDEMRERMVPELRTTVRKWVRSCEDAKKFLPPPKLNG